MDTADPGQGTSGGISPPLSSTVTPPWNALFPALIAVRRAPCKGVEDAKSLPQTIWSRRQESTESACSYPVLRSCMIKNASRSVSSGEIFGSITLRFLQPATYGRRFSTSLLRGIHKLQRHVRSAADPEHR